MKGGTEIMTGHQVTNCMVMSAREVAMYSKTLIRYNVLMCKKN
jgi:hypothetical protein